MKQTFEIDGHSLKIRDVIKIAESKPGEYTLKLSPKAIEQIKKSRETLESQIKLGKTIYGVNTGFGALLDRRIERDEVRLLQRNLILSHSVQVGDPTPIEIAKASMLIRANSLARGYSGVRPVIIETLIEMLNRGVIPVIPSRGSVGASGDLAPLSHVGIVMSKDPRRELQKLEETIVEEISKHGELSETSRMKAISLSGEAYYWDGSEWVRMTGIEAMYRAGIPRLVLEAKEGLALNNGTAFSSALACYITWHGEKIIDYADRVAALSIEAFSGITSAFIPEAMQVRPHQGQRKSADVILNMLMGSKLTRTQELSKMRGIQDPYSFRCVPQVHGPVRDTFEFAKKIIETEINSTTDNPIVFANSELTAVSSGNFHAEYIGYVLDFMAIALTGLSGISERRIYNLLDEKVNRGLPPFLIDGNKPGLQTGYMWFNTPLPHLFLKTKPYHILVWLIVFLPVQDRRTM